jgi:hypothetical protein
MRRQSASVLGLMMVTGCAAIPRPIPTNASAASPVETTTTADQASGAADEPAANADAVQDIPTQCASTDPCAPDPAFVKRLCSGTYPEVALVLMAKDAPFTHMYLRGDVDGWNAEGGLSNRAKLVFDEDVLVLGRGEAPSNAIIVGGGARFLVMRWDGYCYTLAESEITSKRPPKAKHSPIPWRYYSERTKDALLQNADVQAAFQRRGKDCSHTETEEARSACERAELALSAAVVAGIRAGATIPTPDRRP